MLYDKMKYEIQGKFCRVYRDAIYSGEFSNKLDKEWFCIDTAETIPQARIQREDLRNRFRDFGKPQPVFWVFRIFNPKTGREVEANTEFDRMLRNYWNLKASARGMFYGFVREQKKTHLECIQYLNDYLYRDSRFGKLPQKYQELLSAYVNGLWDMVDQFIEFGYKFPDGFKTALDLKGEDLRIAGEMPGGCRWKISKKDYSEFHR